MKKRNVLDLVLFICLSLVLLAVTGCSNGGTTDIDSTSSKNSVKGSSNALSKYDAFEVYSSMSARDFDREYYREYSTVSRDRNKFKDKVIEVHGLISLHVLEAGIHRVVLVSDESDDEAVHCYFEDDKYYDKTSKEYNELMNLKEGQTLTVRGRCERIGQSATLSDCEIVSLDSIENTVQPEESGDFVIDQTGTLTKYTGKGGKVVIPERVKIIGDNVFLKNSEITSVAFPKGLKIIGVAAFMNNINLKTVTIPDNVTSVGKGAFSGCTGLKNVTLSNKITYFGQGAFYECTSLENITLPTGLSDIPDSMFDGCTNLKNVTIPDTVTSIGQFAFQGCPSLTITCSKNSFAEKYAKANGIPVKIL